MKEATRDVVIVGAGPNGLTAASVLARAGLSVLVVERNDRIGGSCRTAELTRPGFAHDVCAAIHPMGMASPIFRKLSLESYGLEWVPAPLALAHPFDDGGAAALSEKVGETEATLDGDGARWIQLVRPFVDQHDAFFSDILRPVRVPQHPLLLARFGALGLLPCSVLVRRFRGERARALFAGCAAHSFLALDALGSAAFGLVLAVAGHASNWPVARGGSQAIVEALAADAQRQGGGCEFITSCEVRSIDELPPSRAVLLDLTPRQILRIAGHAFPASYRRRLERYRYGAAAYKVDYALSRKIPWRAESCTRAATVHVGGSFAEIARAEADATSGRTPEAPFVLVAQQSHIDETRAPAGSHTGWAYCHVPNGASADMTDRIERQIERFAPGFRDTILARHVMAPDDLEQHNPNLVGGDIGGGANTMRQFFFRPTLQWDPYATPNPRLFICSSATPPGGGVHGMCGYWAARSVLRRVFDRSVPVDLRV